MNILDCHDGDRFPCGKSLDVPGTSRRVRIVRCGFGRPSIAQLVECIEDGDGHPDTELTAACKQRFKWAQATEAEMRNLAKWLAEQP